MELEREDLLVFYWRYLQRCNEHRFDQLGEFVADDVNGPLGVASMICAAGELVMIISVRISHRLCDFGGAEARPRQAEFALGIRRRRLDLEIGSESGPVGIIH